MAPVLLAPSPTPAHPLPVLSADATAVLLSTAPPLDLPGAALSSFCGPNAMED